MGDLVGCRFCAVGKGENQVAVGGLRTETLNAEDLFAMDFCQESVRGDSVAAGAVLGGREVLLHSPHTGEPWVCLVYFLFIFIF